MTNWGDGYVTDVVYTQGSYREMTPLWLATAAVMLGHRPPEIDQPFRYADLGCGHGLTATIIAATCPHAEVWGFDFNPAHIESARRLASAAGLTNVHFQEASFAELAERKHTDPDAFDFIVSHGLISWVSAENRERIVRIVGQWLRPGGLACLSYNVISGWAAMVPVQALMRIIAQTNRPRSDQAITGVLDYLDNLKAAGAGFLEAHPVASHRLTEIRKQDPRYVAHEFLNANWTPLAFADVAGAMAEIKCNYIGSATLMENVDPVSVPHGMMSLVTGTADPILRETLRDFAIAKGFRRDVYRRGVLPVPAAEQARALDLIELVWTGRQPENPIRLMTPLGEVQGMPEIYTPLMAMLMAGSCTIGTIRQHDALTKLPVPDILQAVVLLMSGGYAAPALPEAMRSGARAGTDRLNAAIGALNADGGDITRLAAATTGSDMLADLVETLMVREKLSGRSMQLDELAARVLAALTRAGRAVRRDGKDIQDSGEALAIVSASLQAMRGQRLATLERLGVISP